MLKPVRIGEFLHRHKEAVKIQPNTEYSLVTVKLHHNGVVIRGKKKGALLGSNMYSVKKGQFILSGIDARNGAFGIVPEELDGAIITNDFWCFDVDEAKVKRDFFYWLSSTSLFLDACQKASKGETQRIRLQRELFENIEFHFPPIAEQETFLNRIAIYDTHLSALDGEQQKQSEYLKALRQSILQEAIEGKLTADWRRKHPYRAGDPERDAEALLSEIAKHWKLNGIKTRGSKNGQFLNTIPTLRSWIETNIDSIGIVRVGGTPERGNKKFWNGPIPWVSSGEVANCRIQETRESITTEGSKNSAAKALPMGTVLVAMIGQGKTRGQTAILDLSAAINQNVCGIQIDHQLINPKWLWMFFLSQYEFSRSFASGGNQPALNGEKVGSFRVPLPPLAEQAAIVERVAALLAHVDDLEKEVAAQKGHTEELMREVLREAFESV